MTSAALDAPHTAADPGTTTAPAVVTPSTRGRRSWFRRPVVAAVALLLVYIGMSFALNDPRGTLGTDTGGKLATLHMMERNGGLDPDVGYWAERRDPSGDLHPLFYTYRVGDRWVNVTTLPMLYAAYPLYVVGGERAVLLLPMLGAVLCALASAALARRLRGGDGMVAFWVVGLATPVAIYALDFWEHSVGLACMMWAIVLFADVLDRRAGWRGALAGGALFGLAATMRTEALVYLVVAVAVTGLVLLVRERSIVRPAVIGSCAGAGALGVLVCNRLLEQVVLGTDLRGSRVASTAAASGGSVATRVQEAFTTTVGLGFSGLRPSTEWIVGGMVVTFVAVGAWLCTKHDRRCVLGGTAMLVVAAVVYLQRFSQGLGFVPGFLAASPFAAVGIVFAWRMQRLRWLATIAVAALPIAWVSQYSGGADPQWGGRYVLLTGALLAVAGCVVLAGHRRAIVSVALVGALVTIWGAAWLSVRSHTIADGMETILVRHDELLISRQPHMLRETGAFYDADRRWLTATDDATLQRAVRIADQAGIDEFALIGGRSQPAPAHLGPYQRGRRQLVPFIRPDVDLGVVTYRRAP